VASLLRPLHVLLQRVRQVWLLRTSLSDRKRESAYDDLVTRTVTVLAGLAALVIAIAPPLASVLAARDRLYGALETSARLHAAEVTIVARQTPRFWEFDGLHVSAPDARQPLEDERRRVYDLTGRLIIETVSSSELTWPVMSVRVPIMDGQVRLGNAEASRSFRSGLIRATWAALASSLVAALIFVLLRIAPMRLLHQALARASYLSAHDVLTGLPNRALFADRLQQALAQGKRLGKPPALFCIDVDQFKAINDTLGHPAGDRLLCTLSDRLARCLREGDTLARLGGDEFAIIQPYPSSTDDVEALASRLLRVARHPIKIGGQLAYASISIGIALADGQMHGAQLLQNADIALYRAKDNGRSQWCLFDPEMNARLRQRREVENDLRLAVGGNQLVLHYQPQVDLAHDRVVGAEALVRWNRNGNGLVPPDQFMSVAEETGLICPIGAWVLEEACRTAATWPEEISVAVNVSPAQFRTVDLDVAILNALRLSGLAPSRLEIEITEGLLLNDTGDTLRILNRLRAVGVRLAMDDFGTGYSSLGYLHKFHFDKIKIDRHFVEHLTSDPYSAAIVDAVVVMSKALGATTIAEGVETAEQADLLRHKGCKEIQGYLYGRPMPAADFAAMLVDNRLVS
jgi:diguanylate cyclase (GGDEF)-like protein